MNNEFLIKISKKDNHYDWVGLTSEGKIFMWGAAYDDPFEMLPIINSAIFEEMWDQGWRKIEKEQK